MIHLKRVYESPAPGDGRRYLVDRVWPRGLSKEAAALDGWLRDIAPSADLRRWFGHDPARWEEFQARYRQELAAREPARTLETLRREAASGTVTLVFAARDEERNNAVALKDVLDSSTQ